MTYDYQAIIIGSGSAGKDASLLAARSGLRTLLVEAQTLGGVCFHRGCNAVRTLRACATYLNLIKKSGKAGTQVDLVETSLADWLGAQRLSSGRLTQELGRSLDRAGVTVWFGRAAFRDAHELAVVDEEGKTQVVSGQNIIVATGSRPSYPGQPEYGVLNSDQLLRHSAAPADLFIIGGGYLGCEMAAIYRTLGTRVTLVEREARLLPGWDLAASEHFQRTLEDAGVEVLLNERVMVPEANLKQAPRFSLSNGVVLAPTLILIAVGRTPNTERLELTRLGLNDCGPINVNERLQSKIDSIYAIGDVNGICLLDSVAFAQARVAVQTILGKPARFDLHWVPRCLHTDPPIAAVGWTEAEAREAGLDVEILSRSVRLMTDDDLSVIKPEPMQLKLVVQAENARILGCVAIGAKAAEIINLVANAINSGQSARELADLSLIHPSAGEALVRSFQERFDHLAAA